jgi:hypothetical protein
MEHKASETDILVEHKASETESVSVLRWKAWMHLLCWVKKSKWS